ncbi:esterase/lipase family protein [Mangrovitalea sediminis]|uniref:esterase/lipase family protein n=1 Tax=Mangrovitalea sediminis TaxID=1982043 RepID=UPI001D0D54FC|nr:GPI inositol-deacylase [Mangrovitalea sediminis]
MTTSEQDLRGWQAQISAVASGFIGDWLEAQHSPLAIPMQLRTQTGALLPDRASIQTALPDARPQLALFIHGLTELDTIWRYPRQPGVDYGSLLAEERDFSALYLRYNTGLAIADNGRRLNDLLGMLIRHWPVPLERLVLVGHSMGGLVIRSACHQADHDGASWVRRVSDCIYLGSPHQGSPVAKLAHGSAALLQAMPRDYLKVIGELIDLRSQGIRNLTHGDIAERPDERLPLLAGIRHFAGIGALGHRPGHPLTTVLGDALVRPGSAQGQNEPGWQLAGTREFHGVGHIRLAHHSDVYLQIRDWLS